MIVLRACCLYPLLVAVVRVVFFVLVFSSGGVVASASASTPLVAAVSFIALSDGESVEYLDDG